MGRKLLLMEELKILGMCSSGAAAGANDCDAERPVLAGNGAEIRDNVFADIIIPQIEMMAGLVSLLV